MANLKYPIGPHNQLTFDQIFTYENLYACAIDCMRDVRWKPSVQNFEFNLPLEVADLCDLINNNEYKSNGFNTFTISERGKIREIHSVHIKERTIQKALCNFGIKPAVIPRLLYTNCASLQGKGTSFAINQIRHDLLDAYKKYGPNCYILITDYHAFYDSILHNVMVNLMSEYIYDQNVVKLLAYFINMFNTFDNNIISPVIKTKNSLPNPNAIRYNTGQQNERKGLFIPKFNVELDEDLYYRMSDEHIIESLDYGVGLGLGSEISQICAISYTNKLDHAIKEQWRMPYYTKYMDDSYIICPDLNKLKECFEFMKEYSYNNLGLTYNLKHTNFYRITDYFHFLKKQFKLNPETGKLIVQLSPEAITKHRRLIRSHREKLDEGALSFETIFFSFICWRESYKWTDSRNSLRELSLEFNSVFFNELNQEQRNQLLTI